MSVIGKVHAMVMAKELGGALGRVLCDGLSWSSPTMQILASRADLERGPMGDDINLTHETESAVGRPYRGAPPNGSTVETGEPVQTRALWHWYEADQVIRGTDLNQATGMSTAQALADDYIPQNPESQIRGVYDLSEMELKKAVMDMQSYRSAALWETPRTERDNPAYMPEGLPTLFDHDSPWHGLDPAALGSWDDGRSTSPWGTDGPPNADSNYNSFLTSDEQQYRHLPQYFDNGGTARDASEAVLNEPNLAMCTQVPGFWIAPTSIRMFAKMTQKSQGNEMVPMSLGVGGWQKRVSGYLIHRTFYYPDAAAPDDRIYHLHIGEINTDMMQNYGAGFKWVQWMTAEAQEIELIMPAPNPMEHVDFRLGYNTMFSLWTDEWNRSQSNIDSIYNHARTAFAIVGGYRWKNFEVRDLQ